MFTFGVLYVALYIFVFLGLAVFCFLQLPISILTTHSTTNAILFIQRYCSTKTLFLFLLFILTGLPPVGLFFVKFNILVFIFYEAHFISCVTIFFLFFINMLYYTQIFSLKNNKLDTYSIVETSIEKSIKTHETLLNNRSSYKTYTQINFLLNVLLFMFLIIIYFSDILLCILN